VKSLGPSNDDVPEDEITLAELIQNAAARGLTSTQTALYRDSSYADLYGPDRPRRTFSLGAVAEMEDAPAGATCCCVLGAQALTPPVSSPLGAQAYLGNDIDDEHYGVSWDRDSNVGAAFEQALRPEPEPEPEPELSAG
jgi:hypothetical protein